MKNTEEYDYPSHTPQVPNERSKCWPEIYDCFSAGAPEHRERVCVCVVTTVLAKMNQPMRKCPSDFDPKTWHPLRLAEDTSLPLGPSAGAL